MISIPCIESGFAFFVAVKGLATSAVTAAAGSGFAVMVSLLASVTLTTGSAAAGMTGSTAATSETEASWACALALGCWVVSLMASVTLTTGSAVVEVSFSSDPLAATLVGVALRSGVLALVGF